MPRKKKFRFTQRKKKSKKVLEAQQKEREEEDKVKYLKDIYYDSKSPVAYAPFDRLYKYIRKHKGNDFTSEFVKTWLLAQDAFTLHRKRTKPRFFTRIYAPHHGYQLEADIMYFKSLKSSIDKVLVVIDVFSRFLYAEPVSSLQSHHVIEAMKKILSKHSAVKKLRTDAGIEFRSVPFIDFMKKNNVEMIRSYPPRKSAIIERSIKSLKALLAKIMEHRGINDFTQALQEATEAYNFRPHKSLDSLSPTQASNDKYRGRIQNFLNDQHLKRMGPMLEAYKYDMGAPVRVELDQGAFSKDHQSKFSTDIYFITDRTRKDNVNYYKLETAGKEEVKGSFHESELSPVALTKHSEYKIDQVYPGSRTVNNRIYKQVKFQGFPEPLWIPKKDIFDL